jgi:type II secretory pathway component GspD/PulD (secretin)
VVVSASHVMMAQVALIIEQLDADPKGEQKVFVYELKNGDVQNTGEILRTLFQSANSRNTSSSQNRSALETREMQSAQTMQTGFGSTGFGGSSGQGGTGGPTFR